MHATIMTSSLHLMAMHVRAGAAPHRVVGQLHHGLKDAHARARVYRIILRGRGVRSEIRTRLYGVPVHWQA